MLRALPVIVWLCGPAPSPPGRFACAGGGVVEYSGKVACPSGRRCSTRNAVWCHSHPGFKSQRYRRCRPAPLGPGGFVMPTWRVWGACGPDRSPAAARPARPRAVRAASFARCVGSKPGQAPQASRRPPIGRGCLCVAWPGPVARGRRSLASGALHAGGAFVADVARRIGSLSGQALRLEVCPILSFACNSPETLSNHELTTLELQRFQILLKLLPIELHARFGWRWCRRLPRVPQSGPVGQASRWCETLVAFACW